MTFYLFPWKGKPFLNRVLSQRIECDLLEQIISFKELTLIEKRLASLESASIYVKLR